MAQGHGCLNDIYASVERSATLKGWDSVDLVIIGGDFQVCSSRLSCSSVSFSSDLDTQAVRNSYDLACMAVPQKFKAMGDFHEYYSGQRTAPYLTIFVGGNHEASNYMFELYYGGWVAPNIYYLGAANVIRCGPLRIASMSGIWKGYDFRNSHFERLPYNNDDVHGIYHIRELDVRKLLQIQTQVDLGISHDWPKGVELSGDYETLFRRKRGFREDSSLGKLGSPAAKYVLDRLRPAYWFSAHLHVKFAAYIQHGDYIPARGPKARTEPAPGRGSPQTPQLPKVPYAFGLDGTILTTILAENNEENNTSASVDAAHDTRNVGTVPINRAENVPSEATVPETSTDALSQSATLNTPELPSNTVDTSLNDTETRLSAWNNFHQVAAKNEAVENSRYLEEQDRIRAEGFSEIKHNLTWRKVDIDEDGADRRVIGIEKSGLPEGRENKKQKIQHETTSVKNSDEISLDLDSDSEEAVDTMTSGNAGATSAKANPSNTESTLDDSVKGPSKREDSVSEDIRSQLPASFTRPEPAQSAMNGPLPEAISNAVTQFLALDKCEPHRDFLQLAELYPVSEQDDVQTERPYHLQYDKEWLAITRVFANDLQLGDSRAKPPADKGDIFYKSLIAQEEKWIEEHVVKPGKLTIPENFATTAPFYDPSVPVTTTEMPPEYNNPQTAQFCEFIGIENKFYLSDEERQARMQAGPRPRRPDSFRGPPRGGRGRRGGGRGRGSYRY